VLVALEPWVDALLVLGGILALEGGLLAALDALSARLEGGLGAR
jgi:hypothetical protein